MKLTKKGVIEVGFAWIFILIAGVVILALFSYIGVSQGGFFKDLLNSNLLTDLGTIFAGAQISRNTAAVFEIPKTTLDFSCTSYGIDGVSYPMEHRFIFAPPSLTGSEIITWSKSWNTGFRVANFLFITSPYVKYYLFYEPSEKELAEQLYDELPTQLTKELLEIGQGNKIKNENYDRIVVLVVGKSPSGSFGPDIYDPDDFRKYSNEDITFIYADVKKIGTVNQIGLFFKDKQQRFYPETDPDSSGCRLSPDRYTTCAKTVLDLSGLYAAFISGNPELYDCMMDKALQRSKILLEFYRLRTESMKNSGAGLYCTLDLAEAAQLLEQISLDMTPDTTTGRIETRNIINNIVLLEQLNQQLETKTCPLIY